MNIDNKWIPSEMPPEKGVMVQVIQEVNQRSKIVNVGEYIGNNEWNVFTTFGVYESSERTKRVIFWQPMANIYETEGE